MKTCSIRHLVSLILAALLISGISGAAAAQAVLSPGLTGAADDTEAGEREIAVLVFVQSADRAPVKAAAQATLSRSERIKTVSARLKAQRAASQDEVRGFLLQHSVTPMTSYWIAPAYAAVIPASKLNELASLPGVARVVEDVPVSFVEPVETLRTGASMSTSVASALQQINVPALWAQGLTGAGRLVCSFDTGVDSDHPALAGKWRGTHAPLAESWFSKVAPAANPDDNVGHGTHTMGIMVGSTPADSFGVAPQAEWITAGVIDQGRPLSTTISDILEAFEWALNPDGDTATTDDVPDVILNSWGIPKGLFSPCDTTFAQVIENVEEAGIVTVFAAGNEGPNPMTLRNPADMATSPLSTFSVGAVDANNVVAGFSSRGPSSCDQVTIKPELVAPGVNIRSSFKDGEYRIMSGTSMAAPFIAGLVALMREHNPDATVEDIKTAMLEACSDLGAGGEDNAYGHGLIDAALALDLLPSPGEPSFSLGELAFSDDNIALPGEEFDLQITINNAPGNLESAQGTLRMESESGAEVLLDASTFLFGVGGVSATSTTAFTIRYDDTLYNGQVLTFELELSYNSGRDEDTLRFIMPVGDAPIGNFVQQSTPGVSLTVSDFGQFGLAPGSIYNVRGDGFRVDGSENLLYEAGIVLGRNSLQVSSAVRDSAGAYDPTDFSPVEPLSAEWVGLDGGMHRQAEFDDRRSPIRIPITVRQETVTYPNVDDDGLVIVRYFLCNHSLEPVTGLHFGMLVDYDLNGDEAVSFDADQEMIFQQAQSGPLAGLVGLSGVTTYRSYDNPVSGKTGFTPGALFSEISREGVELTAGESGDQFFMIGGGPFNLAPGDSVEVAFALVGGYTMEDLYANGVAARQLFHQATDLDGRPNSLPTTAMLHQNYPNPFNPATVIAFDLPQASEATLTVYNSLGQEVRTLYDGRLQAGRHEVEWNASNTASGVYFYRLSAGDYSQTKKMVLVK